MTQAPMQAPTPIVDAAAPVVLEMATPNRRVGLIVFGIIAIVLGGMALLGAVMVPIGAAMNVMMRNHATGYHPPPVDWRGIVVAVLMYLAVGAMLILTGIGSVKLRRWSRPIMLIIAWTWLLSGVAVMMVWAFMVRDMPDVMRHVMAQSNPNVSMDDVPQAAMILLVVVLTLFQVVLLVLVPGVLVWFYSLTNVRLTLEHYQPMPDWSDRTPTTVLGVSLGLALGAACLPFGLLYPAVPFFGVIATGWLAAGLWTLLAAALAVLAWGIYCQRAWAWWGTLLLSILGAASSIVTFSQVEFIEIYRVMGMDQSQLDMMRQYRALSGPMVNIVTGVMTLAWVVFMLAIRKQFGR